MTGSGAGKGFEYNIRKNFLITAIIPLAVLLALFILFIGFSMRSLSVEGRKGRRRMSGRKFSRWITFTALCVRIRRRMRD